MAMSRFACLVATSAVWQAEAGLHVASFSKYPDYTGAYNVQGIVVMGQTMNNKLVADYRLMDVDKACNGTDNGKANTCGVHVHSGTSCADATGVGGHFFASGMTDPWNAAQYTADSSSGVTMARNMYVNAGTTLAENKGKVMVIHDSDGARIACGVLAEDVVKAGTKPMYADSFGKYPGYTGSLAVAGSVTIREGDAVGSNFGLPLILEYSLTGVDTACKDGADMSAANSCGIHVHQGPCTDHASVAGHYYTGSEDNWKSVVYFADSAGKTGASISYLIQAGISTANLENRSMVIHNIAGDRVGCSDIKMTMTSPGGGSVSGTAATAMSVLTVFAMIALMSLHQ